MSDNTIPLTLGDLILAETDDPFKRLEMVIRKWAVCSQFQVEQERYQTLKEQIDK